MGRLVNGIARWLAPDLMTRPEVERLVAEKVAAARQARPINLDYDPQNEGYRRLTPDPASQRDLTPMSQDMMLELAYYLYDTSGLVKRFVRDTSNFVLGEGVTFSVENDDEQGSAQVWLETMWKVNKLDLRLRKRIEFLCLLGEQCWPTWINPYNGQVLLGYIDPSNIARVEVVTGFPEIPQRVVTRGPAGGSEQYFDAIREDWDPASKSFGRLQGELFFWSINNPPNGTRGRSDLLQSFDFINGLEESLFDEIDRIKLIKAFIWDVTLQGADEEGVREFLKKNKTPKAASVRAHNERVTWQAVAPDLKMADSKTFLDFMKSYLAATQNRPDSWLGSGGKAYQTEAELMGEPTFKDLGAFQLFVKYMLEEVLQFGLDQAVLRRALRERSGARLTVHVNMPEMVAKNLKTIVESLLQLAQGLLLAQAQNWVSQDTATRIYANVAGQLGIEIDAAEEIAQAAKKLVENLPGTEDYAGREALVQEIVERLRGRGDS